MTFICNILHEFVKKTGYLRFIRFKNGFIIHKQEILCSISLILSIGNTI